MLAGTVAVIGKVYLGREALEQPGLLGREGRPEGRAHAAHPVLDQGHHVHISLDEDHALQPALFAKKVCGIDAEAFVEDRCIAGIQVLRLPSVHAAPAESENVAVLIDDRKDHALPEHVPHLARFAFAGLVGHAQARQPQVLFRKAFLTERAEKLIPCGCGGAEAELADSRVGYAAVFEVVQHRFSGVGEQLFVKHAGGFAVDLQQALALIAALLIIRVILQLRERHVHAIREQGNRLLIGEAFDVHDELDHTAARLAAEAVVHLLFGADGEGGGLFAVKRAETPVIPSVLFERNIGGDGLHDIGAGAKLIEPCGWIASGHGASPPPGRLIRRKNRRE